MVSSEVRNYFHRFSEIDFADCRKHLKISHTNVESLVAHKSDFISCYDNGLFDIIAVSETFLKPELPSTAFQMFNYNLYRNDRLAKEGGGVALYVHKGLKCKILKQSNGKYNKSIEYIFAEISNQFNKMLCSVVYRPPKAAGLNEYFAEVQNFVTTYENIVLIGDFNVNINADAQSQYKDQLVDLVKNIGFKILPLEPTFHRTNVHSTLDHIITKNADKVHSTGQFPSSGMSAHDTIYMCLPLMRRNKIHKLIKIRNFKNYNIQNIKADIDNFDFSTIYNSTDLDDKVKILTNFLEYLMNKHFPLKEVRVTKPPTPWLTNDIENLSKKRNKLHRIHRKNDNDDTGKAYKKIRNKVKNMLRNSRFKYIKNQFKNVKNSKEFWKIVKQQGIGKMKNITDEDPKVNLNGLNDFFCKLGTHQNIDSDLIGYYKHSNANIDSKFSFSNVTAEEIKKATNDITSKAMGPDNISCILVKLVLEHIVDVLVHICNYSIEKGLYPSTWKHAYVLPLAKKNPATTYSDFRPITLISVLAKIFDKVMYAKFSAFIEDNNIIDKFQSGYRKNHSTQTAMIHVTDDIRTNIDNSELTIFVSLDLSHAFNSVEHSLFLAILDHIGCENSVTTWFNSYLSNRKQCIRTSKGSLSTWSDLNRGTPQGTTLSSLIFALYLNKICDAISACKRSMYADDLNLYKSTKICNISSNVEMVNNDLKTLTTWFKNHGLVVNPRKSVSMIIGHSRLLAKISIDDVPKINVNDTQLEYKEKLKCLGITLQNNLSWNEQTNAISSKVYSLLYGFKKLLIYKSLNLKKSLTNSLIMPHFIYSLPIMCDLNYVNRIKLQTALNSAVRFILNLNFDDRVRDKFKLLDILKIEEMIKFNVLSYMNLIVTKKQPAYLFEKYSSFSEIHNVNTRNSSISYRLPLCKTTSYHDSFLIRSIILYNDLPQEIKGVKSHNSFKKALKKHFISKY